MKLALSRSSPKPWSPPMLEQPLVISGEDLQPIGERKGRQWYRHPRIGELEVRDLIPRDSDPMPSALLMPAGEDYVLLRAWAPGSFERLSTAQPAASQVVRPSRPVDSLAELPLLAARPMTSIPIAPGIPSAAALSDRRTGYMRDAQGPIRGAEAILETLRKRGVTVTLSADAKSLVVLAPDGRAPGVSEVVQAAAPILLPLLATGKAPACRVSLCGREAVTVSGTTPWCATCAPREVA